MDLLELGKPALGGFDQACQRCTSRTGLKRIAEGDHPGLKPASRLYVIADARWGCAYSSVKQFAFYDLPGLKEHVL